MKLHILGQADAFEHEPIDKTYAIRIFSPNYKYMADKFPLKDSKLYSHISLYLFDDIDPFPSSEGLLFSEDIANNILDDFEKYGKDGDSLLVHCSRGVNRSPAVALALNDIYNLGNDRDKLKEKFMYFTRFVYNTIIETARNRNNT